MRITPADEDRRHEYEACRPDALGNLHQRMKAVMERAATLELWAVDNALWQHLHDLRTEVSYHRPAKPPYGKREVYRA